MAPKLRSSSHARSNNSRPSTPVEAQAGPSTASSFTESTRDRKRRRTGRNTRVATDPPQDTPSLEQLQSQQPPAGTGDVADDVQMYGQPSEWAEPPVRTPAPSYADTPWSAVSSDANPILSTMRPLGALPSAADLRKVGLVPQKPTPQNIPAKKEPEQTILNGDKENGKQTPEAPAEEQVPEDEEATEEVPEMSEEDKALEALLLDESKEVDFSALAAIPIPDSNEFDMEKLKTAVEQAFRLATLTGNNPVVRGLLRMWGDCNRDPFVLSVLDGMLGDDPSKEEMSAFHNMMRAAWRDVRAEENQSTAAPEPPLMARTRSASSVSSLSSAKSLDAETFAPGMAPGAGNSRSRAKGKQTKAKGKEKEAPRSAFPSSNDAINNRKRALEEDPAFSDQAITNKRSRLQKSLPKIVAHESKLRSSLGSNSPSNAASPAPNANNRSQGEAELNGMGRSGSPDSSDAEGNRRLTPTFA